MDSKSRIIYPQDAVQGAEMTQDIAPPQTPVPPTSQQPPSKKSHTPLWLWVLLGVFVVGLIAGGSFYYFKHSHQSAKTVVIVKKCSDDLLQKAATNFDPKQIQQLYDVVKEVKAIPGYDQDPNCLNVVATFYISAGDSVNAKLAMDALEKVYNPSVGFSTYLGHTVRSLAILKSEAGALEKTAQQTKQNGDSLNKSGLRK